MNFRVTDSVATASQLGFHLNHKPRSPWIENQKSVNFNHKLHENTLRSTTTRIKSGESKMAESTGKFTFLKRGPDHTEN